MKIGLVCPYNILKGGGVQECVKALQEGLIARGHDVVIITPKPRELKRPLKNVIFLGSSTDIRSLSTTSQISAGVDSDEIEEMLLREQFDVLHFHEPWVPMLSRQLLSRSDCVNVATFHAKLPDSVMTRTMARVITPYTRSVLKYLHEFTAVSDAALDYLRTMTDEPVSIIPNGIDLEHFHVPRKRKISDDKTILYIGRLEKRKGVNYLLKAFAELAERQKNVKLVIAGDGVDKQKLEIMTQELGIERKVRFLGYISETKKRKLLHDADLFCSPAIFGESFGIVLLEAMASGLVTVAGSNPGYASVLQGMGSVSLVNPKDTQEFSKRIELLLNEPQLRKLWREWARKTVPQYSYNNVVDQYEAVYTAARKRYA
jgi:phosphatidyl-myo-inositol alpha-mannosyltransferase